MSILPADPSGWAIAITDDGLWQPSALDGSVTLPAEPTKLDAVLAIEEHDGRTYLPRDEPNDL